MKIVTSKQEWNTIVKSFPYYNAAHLWGYFAAYQTKQPQSEPLLIYLETENGGKIAYPFFKQKISEDEWELATIYGYTGPLIETNQQKVFNSFCAKENIKRVRENFHPAFNISQIDVI